MKESILGELREHISVMEALAKDTTAMAVVERIAKELAACFRNGHRLYLFGCGGSAADSQHIAAEFINKLHRVRQPLPAIALTTDTSILTAIANDSDFSQVFSRQVEGLACPGDVVIGISTSGRSPAVRNGLTAAKGRGAIPILLTGSAVSAGEGVADHVLNIPSGSTVRVQEAHITVAHILCSLVERDLFP